jgi:hypothetical protein
MRSEIGCPTDGQTPGSAGQAVCFASCEHSLPNAVPTGPEGSAMNRSTILAVLTALAGSLLPQGAGAQMVHFVDNIRACEGRTPCYSTITDAVTAASPFDTIAVFSGVYHEAVAFEGPSKGDITLRSQGGVKPVIAPSSGPGVTILAAPRVQVLNLVIEAQNTAAVSIGGPGSSGYVIQNNWLNGLTSQAARNGTVKGNTFVGSGLSGDLNASVIEGNRFVGAGIFLGEFFQRPDGNLIRRNLLRRGAIDLNAAASGNTIVANFVSGSAGDGISVGVALHGGVNVIERNTSVENAGCDANDRSSDGGNTWRNNRFGTSCGAIGNQARATGKTSATSAASDETPELED